MRNPANQKSAARQFMEFWRGKGYEKGQTQPFWLDLLRVLGVDAPETAIEFEDKAHIDAAHGFIDGYIPATRVMVEQKSLGKNLRAAIPQSDGSLLTPFPNTNTQLKTGNIGTGNTSTMATISQAAQAILDSRVAHPDCSLKVLYDELTMPADLRRTHQENDRAVMAAYGFPTKMTESECVAELFKRYQALVKAIC